ncbi:hypothetical protein ICW40_13765 [Actinotalea ferrariae]|uniref:SatD family protein n=1 Tax=Actinotalea ferrariae TaxID=1386098 RepID=UPI001C8B21D8|nr:SatD family protein [Actinotalea ferrariae]MBX9245870.1 hypothetical protein [Actinotalea ferrariae]
MFVVTVDQIGSRRVGDRVEGLLADLVDPDVVGGGGGAATRGFERTVGDEVQAAFSDADAVVEVALRVLRIGGWSVGIGAGAVDEPMPASVRAAQGPAFVLAREAVEAAKSRMRAVPIAVRGQGRDGAADAEAVLTLLGAVLARRTPAGWAAVDAVRSQPGATQDDVAARLGITQQAVSQRLRTALWSEELAARTAAGRLLVSAEAAGS